jgi:hypothetical protein
MRLDCSREKRGQARFQTTESEPVPVFPGRDRRIAVGMGWE